MNYIFSFINLFNQLKELKDPKVSFFFFFLKFITSLFIWLKDMFMYVVFLKKKKNISAILADDLKY